jgi:glycosyltransferase involved in cell wall biosynthesis
MKRQARDGAVVMLVSSSATPCGVEMFARVLCEAAVPLGLATRTLSVCRDFRDAWRLWRELAGAQALVVNLPVVAWKRTPLTPLLALAIARLRRARTILVLHEWADLQPARRAVYSVYLLLAQTILFSSPFVRAGFETDRPGRRGGSAGLIPIPPNIAPTKARRQTPVSARLAEQRARGRLILGHFGSIYPKKQSDVVLDIAAALRRRGCDVFVVFIGGFIKGHDDIEPRFFARAEALGLADAVLVTGYVETEAEIFTLFDACDAFAYAFAEGLTSRRGSVLACLQTGKPVVADAPLSAEEFAHHRVYRDFIVAGALTFAAKDASPAEYARAIEQALASPTHPIPEVFATAWRDAVSSLRDSVQDEQPALTIASPPRPGRRPERRTGQRGGVRR